MNELSQYYLHYQKLINNLELKHRIIVLIIILGLIFAIWYVGFWHLKQNSISKINAAIKETRPAIILLKTQIKATTTDLNRKRYLATPANIDPKASQYTNTAPFVSIKTATKVLQDLLARLNGLALLQLYNLPPEMVEIPPDNLKVFKHDIVIKFSGDYFATTDYLGLLEKLNWRIFWDKLEYKVIKYPLAEVTLKIHIFSEQGDWFDV